MTEDSIISLWCPDWIDGSGVDAVASWYGAANPAWRRAWACGVDENRFDGMLDFVVSSGEAHRMVDPSGIRGGLLPVQAEMARLRGCHPGPLDTRIIEYASSTVPCELGLHSVDIRYPVPEDAFDGAWRRKPHAAIREMIDEFRALHETLPITWAVCCGFGRGASVAELCQHKSSMATPGLVYLAKTDIAIPLEWANGAGVPIEDVGKGWVVGLTLPFGGHDPPLTHQEHEGLLKAMRKLAIRHAPWGVIEKYCRSGGPNSPK